MLNLSEKIEKFDDVFYNLIVPCWIVPILILETSVLSTQVQCQTTHYNLFNPLEKHGVKGRDIFSNTTNLLNRIYILRTVYHSVVFVIENQHQNLNVLQTQNKKLGLRYSPEV